ncbi:MAG: murein transglycosylase A [Steroidobacteraceae bacterium]
MKGEPKSPDVRILASVIARQPSIVRAAARRETRTAAPWLVIFLALAVAGCEPFQRTEAPAGVVRGESRWSAANWSELPGWSSDLPLQAWPAFLRSCERASSEWSATCTRARQAAPRNDAEAREWFVRNLRPYRVESLQGETRGLITGYYEPTLEARRQPSATFRYPLHAAPADLALRQPYWTRQELESDPAAQAALRGREIAYVADPLEALGLHVQGSGRLRITEADGVVRWARLAYAGNNGRQYQSVGRWLIDRGELPPGQASWPAIRDWAQRNPQRLQELLWANPRYVFFREEPMTDAGLGPRGAQGVALTPGRSIAVDPRGMPYGTPVWIDATEPLSNAPLQRLVVAQDTGSAIVGAVRADYFWGWDARAAEQAGRMKQPLRLWVLWPR